MIYFVKLGVAADGRDMMSSAGFSVNESFADPGFGTLAADFEQVTAIRFGANDPNQANHQVRKINW